MTLEYFYMEKDGEVSGTPKFIINESKYPVECDIKSIKHYPEDSGWGFKGKDILVITLEDIHGNRHKLAFNENDFDGIFEKIKEHLEKEDE